MPRKPHFKHVMAALMLSASAGSMVAATPALAQISEDQKFQLFANSDYNYCDARLVGKYFNRDTYEGKLLIGVKIHNGIGNNIPLILNESRMAGNTCRWQDVPHSYDDAVALGNYWGVEPHQAKAKAAGFYTSGQSGVVTGALANANSVLVRERGALAAYGRSGFSYCDAKLVGANFGETPYEGKVFIGNKVENGLIETVTDYLEQSRDRGNKCRWGEVPYDYDDAETLAGAWNMSIPNAKTTIARFVTLGRGDIVDTSLGR
ncbi:MAG: hypothetical protein ABJP70_13620 [Erythrobacter sp.]